MQRFYLSNTPLLLGDITLTDRDILHQLTRVLRCKIGDNYAFFDGKTPEDYVYKVTEMSKTSISLSYEQKTQKNSELDFEMTLYQALPNKFSKLEYIVQKCSEIGFSKIVFFSAERSQKLILSENKKERLKKIMQESIEQCGRNRLCRLEFPTSLSIDQ
jgi:16S rRNA (uracil1498-N3)-methyltransferase